jgi:hypothetical protein
VAATTLTDRCASCDTELAGRRYCGSCGERKLDRNDYSALHFLKHAFHEITNLDAKALRTGIALLARPGVLTSEFLAGRRQGYLKPMTLFVLVNVAFFLVGYRLGLFHWKLAGYSSGEFGSYFSALAERKTAALGITAEQFAMRFDEVAPDVQRTMFFFSIFALALVLAPLFRRRYFVEHLVYSTHFHAFFLLFCVIWLPLMLLVLGLVALAGWPGPFVFFTRDGVVIPLLVGVAVYHCAAIGRVYRTSRAVSLAAGAALMIAEPVIWFYLFRPLSFVAIYLLV